MFDVRRHLVGKGDKMIQAVVFDMFETLVTLFEGKTYFGENIAADVGADPELFRKEWHSIEKERSTGVYTIEQGLEIVLKRLGVYSEENIRIAANKRKENLEDTFSKVPEDSIRLLQELKKRGIKVGLIILPFLCIPVINIINNVKMQNIMMNYFFHSIFYLDVQIISLR